MGDMKMCTKCGYYKRGEGLQNQEVPGVGRTIQNELKHRHPAKS